MHKAHKSPSSQPNKLKILAIFHSAALPLMVTQQSALFCFIPLQLSTQRPFFSLWWRNNLPPTLFCFIPPSANRSHWGSQQAGQQDSGGTLERYRQGWQERTHWVHLKWRGLCQGFVSVEGPIMSLVEFDMDGGLVVVRKMAASPDTGWHAVAVGSPFPSRHLWWLHTWWAEFTIPLRHLGWL